MNGKFIVFTLVALFLFRMTPKSLKDRIYDSDYAVIRAASFLIKTPSTAPYFFITSLLTSIVSISISQYTVFSCVVNTAFILASVLFYFGGPEEAENRCEPNIHVLRYSCQKCGNENALITRHSTLLDKCVEGFVWDEKLLCTAIGLGNVGYYICWSVLLIAKSIVNLLLINFTETEIIQKIYKESLRSFCWVYALYGVISGAYDFLVASLAYKQGRSPLDGIPLSQAFDQLKTGRQILLTIKPGDVVVQVNINALKHDLQDESFLNGIEQFISGGLHDEKRAVQLKDKQWGILDAEAMNFKQAIQYLLSQRMIWSQGRWIWRFV